MAITLKQKAVFQYIKTYLSKNGLSPTFDEIAQHLKYKSKGTVYKHVKALKQKGLIQQDWNRARSIKISKKLKTTTERLPVKGEWIKDKINWFLQPYNYIDVPPDVVHNNHSYVIKMETDELKKDHIIKKDILIVNPNTTKSSTGKIIIQNKNKKSRLITKINTSKKEECIGQITGVFRTWQKKP
ncbi:MAG: LexA family protein [Fidelibacterota bacterium]